MIIVFVKDEKGKMIDGRTLLVRVRKYPPVPVLSIAEIPCDEKVQCTQGGTISTELPELSPRTMPEELLVPSPKITVQLVEALSEGTKEYEGIVISDEHGQNLLSTRFRHHGPLKVPRKAHDSNVKMPRIAHYSTSEYIG